MLRKLVWYNVESRYLKHACTFCVVRKDEMA